MQLLIIAAMLVVACSVIFALQNSIPVTVTFLLWRFDSSLAVVLLLALALGGLIVALVSTPSTIRRQWIIARQNKRIAELESRLPVVEPAPATARPDAGLRQISGGAGSGDTQDLPPPV